MHDTNEMKINERSSSVREHRLNLPNCGRISR